jgi:uncharacterized membrane protein HdeD (DUF308 family)
MSDSTARRRRRRGRRGSNEEGPSYQQQVAPKTPPRSGRTRALPDWQWRTFPVFFAFMLGIVVMGLAAPTPLGIIFFVGLFGLAYGAAHILTRLWVSRRKG